MRDRPFFSLGYILYKTCAWHTDKNPSPLLLVLSCHRNEFQLAKFCLNYILDAYSISFYVVKLTKSLRHKGKYFTVCVDRL